MRKQYQWIVIMIFAGILCCTSQDNNLKACEKSATVCPMTKKKFVNTVKPVQKITVEYGSEQYRSLYMPEDPFIFSN